jgi:cold shock CspA family protein/thioredoxin-like negative regulator of GroEL
MTQPSELRAQAKQLYDAKQFAEAGELFRQLWEGEGDAFSGSRYALCLRKTARADEALVVAQAVAEKYPDDIYVRREVVWALYEAEFKPARDRNDLDALVRAGQQIVDLTDEELPIRLVCFAIVDLAKEKTKWPLVSAWCDRLDPQKLSPESREMNGRRVMSEREQWYFAKIKSLVELKRWEEARTLAREALTTFPRQRDFARWSAQALAGQGHVTEAIAELESLARTRQPEWYLLNDLAELQHRAGQTEDAYRTACRAALAFGEDKAKVDLFTLIGRIALDLHRFDVAARHLKLTQLVRTREGWSVPGEVVYLENRVRAAAKQAGETLGDLPDELSKLRALCRRDWEEAVPADQRAQSVQHGHARPQRSPAPALQTDGQTHTGRIKMYREDRGFGFITPDDGGTDIFFHITQVHDMELPMQGVPVQYEVSQTSKGLNAVNVRPIPGSR